MTVGTNEQTHIANGAKGILAAIKLQTAAITIVLAGVWLYRPQDLRSFAYGELVALAGTVWIWDRARKLIKYRSMDAQASLRYLQITSIGRLLIAVCMLAMPLLQRNKWQFGWVVAGFAAAQMIGLVSMAYSQTKADRI